MAIWFTIQYWSIAPVGSPIRKSRDQWIFAPPPGLSQLVTSFFGSWCQGIRRMLFLAWPRRSFYFVFVTLASNDLSFSLSFHYVSKSCKVFRYQQCFSTLLVTLFYLKKPLFFLTYFFSVIQFSNNIFSSILDAWKVNSVKRLMCRNFFLTDH